MRWQHAYPCEAASYHPDCDSRDNECYRATTQTALFAAILRVFVVMTAIAAAMMAAVAWQHPSLRERALAVSQESPVNEA